MEKKSVIITTINPYNTTSIDDYILHDYNVIVVGDKKTPKETYENKNITFIDIKHPLFIKFSESLPYNHYCRKNLGYLQAINDNTDIIFDTDDDNYPLCNFNSYKDILNNTKTVLSPKFPNMMSLFTDIDIWPRGFPIELVNKQETIQLNVSPEDEKNKIGIIQSLAEGDPDVDAIYRLTNKNYNKNITFDKNKSFICNKNVYTQGNTQATMWIKKEIFHLLYIPCTVSFRFCDILKMYIAQKCMWAYDKLLCYISPIVKQDRNDHDFMHDFISEYPMYTNIFKIVNEIFENIKLNGNKHDILIIYKELYKHDIVKELEIELVTEWLKFI